MGSDPHIFHGMSLKRSKHNLKVCFAAISAIDFDVSVSKCHRVGMCFAVTGFDEAIDGAPGASSCALEKPARPKAVLGENLPPSFGEASVVLFVFHPLLAVSLRSTLQ